MPTYVYRCQKCEDTFEVVQSMSDAPLKRCKKCRGGLKRVFHPVGIVLKGSGFYKTDYGRKKSGSDSSSESSSDSSSSSSSSSDSGSKTASDSKKSDSSSTSSKSASAAD